MPPKVLWLNGRKFFLFDKFSTWNDAYKTAKRYKKKKNKYFILKHETSGLFPHTIYTLYLDRTMRLW